MYEKHKLARQEEFPPMPRHWYKPCCWC